MDWHEHDEHSERYYGRWGGYDDQDERAERYYGRWEIDVEWPRFRKESHTRLALSTVSSRTYLFYLLCELRGSYFMWLPNELIELVMEYSRRMMVREESCYYMNYFSEGEILPLCLRYLRPTAQQKEVMNVGGGKLVLQTHETPLGSIKVRGLYGTNTASLCFNDMRLAIETGVKTVEGVQLLYTQITKWFVWICDQSYLNKWRNLMKMIVQKIYEFERDIIIQKVQTSRGEPTEDRCRSLEKIDRVHDIICDIKYFVSKYTPFALLSRSDTFYDVVHKEYSLDALELVVDLQIETNVSPSTIDIQEAYEFEMSVYAPTYYQDTYIKYMMLRNGKRIIPQGKIPKFYWYNDKYTQRFV